MSFSQKHAGKVLVPWFNKAEWHAVYGFIYSEAPNWPKALEILKIWKHRTPLLSAGVEGTLIILEALLVNTNQLSGFEISQIFSTSLVRFLNLCAANSDKQGSFYKTALKNELPKWLVNIRHDIAHSHKIPSLSMLELSLKFCLEWLEEKYWGIQCDNMSDFIVGKVKHKIIEHGVFIHKCIGFEINERNKKLMKCINNFMPKRKGKVSSEKVIRCVNEELCKEIKSNRERSAEKISFLLLDVLFLSAVEIEEDGIRKQKIPGEFFQRWNNLINVIYEAGILQYFVSKLFDFTCDENQSLAQKEIAALMIKEIFKGLKNAEGENSIIFKSRNDSMKNKDFALGILDKLSPFTLIFMQEVFEYNNAPPEFIEDSISLVQALNPSKKCTSDRIFTVDDIDDQIIKEKVGSVNNEAAKPSNSRWILIEDTSPYEMFPLGILPHQDRDINPMFVT